METPQERRKRLEAEAAEDLEKSVPQLLADVHDESVRAVERNSAALARTIARFAALLGVLSKQSAEQASKNLKAQDDMLTVTRRLFHITIGLGIVAVAQIVFAYLQPNAVKVSHAQTQQTQEYKSHDTEKHLEPEVKRPVQQKLQPPNK